MKLRDLFLCCGLAAFLTSCFVEDPALSGPTAEGLERARRAGDIPFNVSLESVTFVNAVTNEQVTVDLGSSAVWVNNCNSPWCNLGNPITNVPYYCPGGPEPDDPGSGASVQQGIQFTYDDTTDKIAFRGFDLSPTFLIWAEDGLFFDITTSGDEVTLSCSTCEGKYEDFVYTERHVKLADRE